MRRLPVSFKLKTAIWLKVLGRGVSWQGISSRNYVLFLEARDTLRGRRYLQHGAARRGEGGDGGEELAVALLTRTADHLEPSTSERQTRRGKAIKADRKMVQEAPYGCTRTGNDGRRRNGGEERQG